MSFRIAVLLGKLLRLAIRQFRKGGGSALPGLVVSKLFPNLLKSVLESFPQGLVIVTGSAGKSTTTKMLVNILERHGLEVFTNPSTANINQGLFATIVEKAPLFRRVPGSIAVLEVDEAHAELLTSKVSPRIVTILNVMEDQLDRFQDPSVVRKHLEVTAQRATEKLILNADDPNVRLIAKAQNSDSTISWFGIDKSSIKQQKNGLSFSPVYGDYPTRPKVSAEVSKYKNAAFTVELEGLSKKSVTLQNRGLHYAGDAIAALQTAREILGTSFELPKAVETLSNMDPVFARGELTKVRGQLVEFILVQNPGSMQLNLDNLSSQPEQLFFAIGRDVHDPSWMWSVDFSNFSHVDVVSGFNASEAELVLKYKGIPVDFSSDDLELALDTFFALPEPAEGVKTMIFSADAMRRIRRSLGFWSPDEVGL